jgi:ABC-2 type transport system permease protein
MVLIRLIGIELEKIFRRGRTYISIGAVIALVSLVQFGFWWSSRSNSFGMMRDLQDSFYFQGNVLNVYTISLILMESMWFHMPLLIAIVTGDLLAGEANSGTYRILLTRPVSRLKVVTAKFITGMVYSTILVFILALFSFVIGIVLFGKGDLIVFKKTLSVFVDGDIIWRFVLAYIFGALSMSVIVALSFLLSGFTSNSIGPIIGTIVIVVVFNIISAIDVSIFKIIKPYLFTNYLSNWNLIFNYDIDYRLINKSALILGGHVVAFFGFAAWFFNRKDILS